MHNPAKQYSQGEKRVLLLVASMNITYEKKSVNLCLRVDTENCGKIVENPDLGLICVNNHTMVI